MDIKYFPLEENGGSGAGGIVIQANDTETVDGWDVPSLTSEQVITAYNALVGGSSVTITSEDGDIQFKAVLGDATPENPYIAIQYYWLGWVEYQATSGEMATADTHKIPEEPAYKITSVTIGTDTIDVTII